MIDYLHWQSYSASILIFAYLLDFVIADPRWLPHPVVIIGSLINKLEGLLRGLFMSPLALRFAGVILTLMTVSVTFIISFALFKLLQVISEKGSIWHYLSILILIYLTSTTIAAKGLIDSCKAVIDDIKASNLEGARQRLSMIVGRDTDHLTKDDILKATIETLSENLSDGVVAPVFYYFLGGLPLAMAYKAVNTLDSMVGYKNDKYKDFGWASARLDDIANFLPARITGLIIILATLVVNRNFFLVKRSFTTLIRDGDKHLSPNSGIPESAMAGAIGIRLGGPSYYGGMLVCKPYIGQSFDVDYLLASDKALLIARATILLSLIIFAFLIF